MKKKYLFQRKSFWLVLLGLYVVIFLIRPVMHYDHDFGQETWEFEPVYHLILRNLGLTEGGEYSRFSDSLDPILWQLPSQLTGFVILTAVVVLVIFIVQKLASSFSKVRSSRRSLP